MMYCFPRSLIKIIIYLDAQIHNQVGFKRELLKEVKAFVLDAS